MVSPFVGYEGVEDVLRRRGQVPVIKNSVREVLLPLDRVPVLSGEEYNTYLQLFGKRSFRKVAQKLISAHGQPVPMEALHEVAGSAATSYVEFLESLGVARSGAGGVALTRLIDNIGPSLEWYVAQLCERELAGGAQWAVHLEEIPVGGDYDVLAWLSPTLVYIELKSSHPSQVSDGELRNFLQRSEALAPDMAVLLIDTDEGLTELLDRLLKIMLPLLRPLGTPPTWSPEQPFIRPCEGFPGVSFGYDRIYVTNSRPTILTQLRRCLRHYHVHVKGVARRSRPTVNFVTGYRSDYV